MNIHEYQAKEIFKKYNINVPQGFLIADEPKELNIEQIKHSLEALGSKVFAVKAQIHAGGRGKAGGVKIAKSADDAIEKIKGILGHNLVTHQTTKEGQLVRKVYIEAGQNIKKEYYLSLVIDRSSQKIVIIASSEGGIDIEEVAEKHPEKIVKVYIDPQTGISDFHGRKIGFKLEFSTEQLKKFLPIINALYKLFIEKDAAQIEVNPLMEDDKGNFIALDGKINFDDNALFKHKEIAALRDIYEEDPQEIEASKFGLNYVKMDGVIGCMVNGAGLAMATMDIIQYYGSSPANFLDVGGGATLEQVTEAFKLIMADNKVKGILINIFGGIMRCDIIAQGVIDAAKDMKLNINIPIVVRLVGTNYKEGRALIANSGLNITSAEELGEAAEKIVQMVRAAENK